MESGGAVECKLVKHMRCHGNIVDLDQARRT